MIVCPTCSAATTVEETRGERRRRVCLNHTCRRKFTTMEYFVEDARRYDQSVVVIRKDLEQILRIVGKALLPSTSAEQISKLLAAAIALPAEEPKPAAPSRKKATSTGEVSPDPGDDLVKPTEEASMTDEGLTREQLLEVGIDPDNEEQLASLGLVVRKST